MLSNENLKAVKELAQSADILDFNASGFFAGMGCGGVNRKF